MDTKSYLKNNITISKEATIIEITMQVYRVQVVNGRVALVSISVSRNFIRFLNLNDKENKTKWMIPSLVLKII